MVSMSKLFVSWYSKVFFSSSIVTALSLFLWILSFSSAFSSSSSLVFPAAFYYSSVLPMTLALFSSKFGVLLNNSSLSRDLNFEWPTQWAGLSFSLNIFLKRHTNGFFHHNSLDSPTLVHSSVSEIHNHNILDLPQLVFSLIYPPIFGLFINFPLFIGVRFWPNFVNIHTIPIVRTCAPLVW